MKSARAAWHVAELDAGTHDRSAFACGAPELDAYLRTYATQDVKRDLARVYVATEPGAAAVRGYYSLSAASFAKARLPAERSRRLPHYPVPGALLGRLAVDRAAADRGLGAHLLVDAMERVLAASSQVAIHALLVDARDDTAARFYIHHGFLAFADNPRTLYLPLATIRALPRP